MNKKILLWIVIPIILIGPIIFAYYLNSNSGISNNFKVNIIKNIDKNFVDDTLVNFSLKGKKIEFKIKKTNISELFEFSKFINENINKMEYKLENKSDTLIEITGEGILNKCITWARMSGNNVLLTHQIIQNDSIIWNDSLVINDDILNHGDIMDDSLYVYLKPYSQFFIAYRFNEFFNFIGDKININSDLYKDNESTINANVNYDSDPTYWKNFFENFNGRSIEKLGFGDEGLYMWDKRKREFILIYLP